MMKPIIRQIVVGKGPRARFVEVVERAARTPEARKGIDLLTPRQKELIRQQVAALFDSY